MTTWSTEAPGNVREPAGADSPASRPRWILPQEAEESCEETASTDRVLEVGELERLFVGDVYRRLRSLLVVERELKERIRRRHERAEFHWRERELRQEEELAARRRRAEASFTEARLRAQKEGRAEGFREGFDKGLEEGRRLGLEKGRLEGARSAYPSGVEEKGGQTE